MTAALSHGPISVTTGAFIQRLTRGLEGDVVVVETEMPSCCTTAFEDEGRGCEPRDGRQATQRLHPCRALASALETFFGLLQISKSTTKLVIICYSADREESKTSLDSFPCLCDRPLGRKACREQHGDFSPLLDCPSAVLLCICPEPLLQEKGNSFFSPRAKTSKARAQLISTVARIPYRL